MEQLNQAQDTDKQALNWAMLCHLSALSIYIGIPFGNILGPLIIWLMKRAEYPLVEKNGKESLNFQISVTIYAIVCGLLMFAFIGFILLPTLLVIQLVLTIIAAVKTSDGEQYRYPFTIRLIK
ncbi:MAG: DUF4870 domain-containing protein [Desulfobulbaceae bacterium]|nr:DUF4870 domain-containing protein [Desulfobulbaceae bacterium]